MTPPGDLIRIWVYLSETPLLWLTATLFAFVLACTGADFGRASRSPSCGRRQTLIVTPNGLELSGSTRRQTPLSWRARRVPPFARGVTDGVLLCGERPESGSRVRTPVLSAAAKG